MTKALLVDLNNFGRYPTLAIGYLVASLRAADYDVEVLSPLAYGVPAIKRERRESAFDQFQRQVYFSTHPVTVRAHDFIRDRRTRWVQRPHPRVIEETTRALERDAPDILLVSAYLDHHPSVMALGDLAARRGIPLLLGGPYFNVPEVAHEWLDVPGLAAIVGGEVDFTLPEIVGDVLAGRDVTRHPGVFTPDGRESAAAPPQQGLDALPVPDFSDFPWQSYPNRIIPAMAARGCGWGRCLFCSDIKSANGRTYRARTADTVLEELKHQSQRYGSRDVIFLDIKLNSQMPLWRGLIDGYQRALPGGRWIGTVHVQARGENGLTREELQAARDAGMVRTTFGLETGSQRVNNSMAKGTSLERTSQFIQDAHAVGLSIRTTAMLGYPGEQAEDVAASVRFIEEHERCLDRIALARFKVIPGTIFHRRYEQSPARYPDVQGLRWNMRYGRATYRNAQTTDRAYRRAKSRLLDTVHRINSRPLRPGAEAFDGLM
jgi:anaerobic magnesium-protoporphyrin IX monomethyl ester cyclase